MAPSRRHFILVNSRSCFRVVSTAVSLILMSAPLRASRRMGRALECRTERGSTFCDVPTEATTSVPPDRPLRSGWPSTMQARLAATPRRAGLSSSCSRSGSTELRMQSKTNESSRNGVVRRRKLSCAVTLLRSISWQSASRLILRDARLRRAPQDEGLSEPGRPKRPQGWYRHCYLPRLAPASPRL
jgi:hypothetical protein